VKKIGRGEQRMPTPVALDRGEVAERGAAALSVRYLGSRHSAS